MNILNYIKKINSFLDIDNYCLLLLKLLSIVDKIKFEIHLLN